MGEMIECSCAFGLVAALAVAVMVAVLWHGGGSEG
jgi:hypothetical protein